MRPSALVLDTGSYLATTRDLCPEQHGLLFLLLTMAARSGGDLPDEDATLARWCGIRIDRWRRVGRPLLDRFFTLTEQGWRQQADLGAAERRQVTKISRSSQDHLDFISDNHLEINNSAVSVADPPQAPAKAIPSRLEAKPISPKPLIRNGSNIPDTSLDDLDLISHNPLNTHAFENCNGLATNGRASPADETADHPDFISDKPLKMQKNGVSGPDSADGVSKSEIHRSHIETLVRVENKTPLLSLCGGNLSSSPPLGVPPPSLHSMIETSESDLVAKAASIWNEVCGRAGLPAVSKVNDARRRGFKRVLGEMRGDLGRWRNYCATIASDPHCCGNNDRGWLASIDYALRPGTVDKVRERANARLQAERRSNTRSLNPWSGS